MPAVHGLAAFSDNYIWLLENDDGTAFVVDPGESAPVEAALQTRSLRLAAILLTHHHFDHVGGVAALKSAHSCTVYGPANPAIRDIDVILRDGDAISLGDYDFSVIEVPGHTLDHIAYFQSEKPGQTALPGPLLFCGDTLFAGGCGRIFEGDPQMMFASLQRLAALPEATAVYCAHEYTLANLQFARTADPDNLVLAAREQQAKALRKEGLPTVPSTIAVELATNPFLRSHDAGVQRSLYDHTERAGNDDVEAFAGLRAWKDDF